MDRNLVYEWQRVQLQPGVDDNHVQRHVPDKNAVPDCIGDDASSPLDSILGVGLFRCRSSTEHWLVGDPFPPHQRWLTDQN
jgi:hypothetical protein